jgi:gamma-glutamylcyclotransferase (GGCT)/AIG2-like uncharacterized protein YtfP
MTHRLFAYGLLEIPSLMQELLGRNFPSEEAVLHGYDRFLLEGKDYPGIIQKEGRITEGTLYSGLDGTSIEKLDAFEDDVYERREVFVQTSRGLEHRAWAYVIPGQSRSVLSTKRWNPRRA